MKNKNSFIRTYTRTELSGLYNPHLTPRYAIKVLKRWIEHNPELSRKLKVYGYRRDSRIFTPRQVEILVEFLGEP